jgi:hypothetical protein
LCNGASESFDYIGVNLCSSVVKNEFIPPTECPVCGEDVPRGAKACPGCGADERSGWDEEATRYDGLDLPADAFDDREHPPARPQSDLLRNVVIVALIGAIILLFVFR